MLASASSLHIQLLSSDSSVYFKSYIPTHHQDLHIHNQRAKQKQTTWNTTHPRWLQETKPTSKPHEILRKTQIGACSTEGKKNNLEVACWDRPNLIPHVVPLFISILQRFASTHLAVSSVRGRRHGLSPFLAYTFIYMTHPHHTDDHNLLIHSSFPLHVWPILSRTGLQRSIPPEEGANIFQVSTFQRVVLGMQSSPGIKNRFSCYLLLCYKKSTKPDGYFNLPQRWISSQQ